VRGIGYRFNDRTVRHEAGQRNIKRQVTGQAGDVFAR
jgi:hypothetical protein